MKNENLATAIGLISIILFFSTILTIFIVFVYNNIPTIEYITICNTESREVQSTNITGRDTAGGEGVAVGGIYGCMAGVGVGAVGGPVGMIPGCIIGAIGLGAVGGVAGSTEESNIYIVTDTEGNQYSCKRDICLDLQSNQWEIQEKTLSREKCETKKI